MHAAQLVGCSSVFYQGSASSVITEHIVAVTSQLVLRPPVSDVVPEQISAEQVLYIEKVCPAAHQLVVSQCLCTRETGSLQTSRMLALMISRATFQHLVLHGWQQRLSQKGCSARSRADAFSQINVTRVSCLASACCSWRCSMAMLLMPGRSQQAHF